MGTVSLDRALSKLGLASRTEARTLVAAGRVRVNGRVATSPAMPVRPETVTIAIDGREERSAPRRVIAFHKPRGVVTTKRDPEGRRTVFDVLGEAGHGLVAVGRLDMASTGLLLLTNDTQLGEALTDPANRVPRRYIVTVRGRVEDDAVGCLVDGLEVPARDAARERLAASRVRILKASGRETHVEVELVEGRNREIRRLFDAIGHEVTRLHRVSFGPVTLGDLPPGGWRDESSLRA